MVKYSYYYNGKLTTRPYAYNDFDPDIIIFTHVPID